MAQTRIPLHVARMALAQRRGATLGMEVARIVEESLSAVQGDLGTTYEMVDSPRQSLSRAEIKEQV